MHEVLLKIEWNSPENYEKFSQKLPKIFFKMGDILIKMSDILCCICHMATFVVSLGML